MIEVVGILLAAGGGRRMGVPKALVRDEHGTSWLARSIATLHVGGCTRVVTVLGAEAPRARALVDESAGSRTRVVVADDWRRGMSASLRAGLAAADDEPADVALVHLVDLPQVGADVISRVIAHARDASDAAGILARATYAGRPGHPVAVGRDHWHAFTAGLDGDNGGKMYLDSRPTVSIDCSDLSDGADVDTSVTEESL